MYRFFIFFIVSGFCSLVYQVVWLRVAMANFGVTAPSVSIVLSVFMAGLALGSWGGGRLVSRLRSGTARSFLRLYAATEAVIGISGFVVVPLLGVGHNILVKASETTWGSNTYYLVSGALITVALLPFCTCMGATFPLAMAAVRDAYADKSETSFSYLYVANVLGAMGGCFFSAFVLIELVGFRETMLVASCLNLLVALGALLVSTQMDSAGKTEDAEPPQQIVRPSIVQEWKLLVMLFMTGLVSLAMEVVWTRQFVPFLGPVVYTFAAILLIYLAATLLGSRVYRARFQHHPFITNGPGWKMLLILAGAAALLPLVAADYRLPFPNGLLAGLVRLTFGIGPFCALLGFLTPGILDRVSSGNPERAGFAYALNTVGCIIGPLLAGFLLLPLSGERWSLVLLAFPLFVIGLLPDRNTVEASARAIPKVYLRGGFVALVTLSLFIIAATKDFERKYPQGVVRRDHTATVIAAGEGMGKQLLVNGYGMTVLTPITKMMVHLPLVSLERPPQKGLVLCLGMGTSFRSMLSWGISSTVVELVPSIPSLLPFYQADGDKLLRAPNGRIVVDDARRFLERSQDKFDVIVVDPPPPVEAAATSLLYSKEFYTAVAKRLAPDGIFQQWIPVGPGGTDEPMVEAAMAKAIVESFPYVRVFASFAGGGLHILASRKPISFKTPAQMASLLPEKAASDLVEWGPFASPQAQFEKVLSQEVPVQEIIALSPGTPTLSDDRPVNEYFLLRGLFRWI